MKKSVNKTTIQKGKSAIINAIKQLSSRYGTWEVFNDFLVIAATSISNAVDPLHREEREKQYIEVIKKYTNLEERNLFPKMFAWLVEELEERQAEEGPTDVLGVIFHELELHNKYKGQFFTPQSIADFMGQIVGQETIKQIDEKGFIKACEPSCGSGVMVLSLAKALSGNGYSYNRNMVVLAADIDIKCVHMAYIQLSLYGIPVVVIHANSLSMETFSRWYTPVYIFDNWLWRCQCSLANGPNIEDKKLKQCIEPMYKVWKDLKENIIDEQPTTIKPTSGNFKTEIILNEAKNGQLSLF